MTTLRDGPARGRGHFTPQVRGSWRRPGSRRPPRPASPALAAGCASGTPGSPKTPHPASASFPAGAAAPPAITRAAARAVLPSYARLDNAASQRLDSQLPATIETLPRLTTGQAGNVILRRHPQPSQPFTCTNPVFSIPARPGNGARWLAVDATAHPIARGAATGQLLLFTAQGPGGPCILAAPTPAASGAPPPIALSPVLVIPPAELPARPVALS